MFTKNIKDSFTANLLSAVSGVLGEAKKKKCAEGCECEACEAEDAEETKEGYMPTNDMPSAKDRATAGKLGALLKRERSTKEKKEPMGVKTEEVEDIEEKRGLWDNIHAKRKRIKAGSGERMRKPGSEGAPSAADLKASQKESVDEAFEQIDEISKGTMGRYINKAKDHIDSASYRQGHKEAHGSTSRPLEKKLSKRHKGIETAVKKLTKEDSEQIDELSKATLGSYIKKASGAEQPKNVMSPKNVPLTKIAAYQGDSETGHFGTRFNQHTYDKAERLRKNRETGIKTAVNKLTKEDSEQIDELSINTLDSYRSKARNQIIAARNKDTDTTEKRLKGYTKASQNIQKNFVKGKGMSEESEQIDELSKETLGSYIKKSSAAQYGSGEKKDLRKGLRRHASIDTAVNKLTKEEQDFIDSLNADTLDEARGRPRKAGAKDFTIHPKTKEKLMHDNPEHMKKIEALQRTGMLQKPKTEAGQHIMNQLRKAKTSMLGGSTVNFTHGDSKHVSGTHAAKLLDRYAGMKPDEKEAFQKKIGHSHAKLKSEL